MEVKKEHTPLPWQKSYYVHRKEYDMNGPEWRRDMERNEDTIVRGPGQVGTPGCNVIGRFNTKEDRDFCVETIASHSALVAACEAILQTSDSGRGVFMARCAARDALKLAKALSAHKKGAGDAH